MGLAANGLPTLGVFLVGRRPMAPVTHATAKFLTALALFPIDWAVLRWWVLDGAPSPWLLTLFVGPLCGLTALWCVGRAIRARRARLGFRRLAAATGALEDLRARRARLVEAVRTATVARAPDDRRGREGAGSLGVRP